MSRENIARWFSEQKNRNTRPALVVSMTCEAGGGQKPPSRSPVPASAPPAPRPGKHRKIEEQNNDKYRFQHISTT